ncbi:hypothetical protein RchiOBHm_Chr7g0200661 [Rosa chinensis]|uniref:Uncharacterized protein n=1 Tax=Rosa chinensis TaxID=74649 RepID=A0A2P6P7T9_ROSCH|nr:hypothetical protein RchiOBHm_Chr7g0200661 [Rosa chinensis]
MTCAHIIACSSDKILFPFILWRTGITPPTVFIIFAGSFKGMRIIFLKYINCSKRIKGSVFVCLSLV